MTDFSERDKGMPPVIDPQDFSHADDNVVQGFQLESSSLRGRSVRLGSVLDEVLGAHSYPDPVAHLVAETMTLAVLLSSMLKFEGIFTLQAKGDGPVSMLVADVTSDGDLRGCATFDEERLQHAREQLSALKSVESAQNHLAQYLGKGYIAFTVDQGRASRSGGGSGDRYQGIVELQGSSLIECAQHYFMQSEQITTGIKMATGVRDGRWRAGGLMLQLVPDEGGNAPRFDHAHAQKGQSNLEEDDWRRAMVLLDSCTEDELLDDDLHSNVLLRRLYHEEGVRVFEPLAIRHQCRCSVERVSYALSTIQNEDLSDLVEDGVLPIKCEFCSREYRFDPKTLKPIQ